MMKDKLPIEIIIEGNRGEKEENILKEYGQKRK